MRPLIGGVRFGGNRNRRTAGRTLANRSAAAFAVSRSSGS